MTPPWDGTHVPPGAKSGVSSSGPPASRFSCREQRSVEGARLQLAGSARPTGTAALPTVPPHCPSPLCNQDAATPQSRLAPPAAPTEGPAQEVACAPASHPATPARGRGAAPAPPASSGLSSDPVGSRTMEQMEQFRVTRSLENPRPEPQASVPLPWVNVRDQLFCSLLPFVPQSWWQAEMSRLPGMGDRELCELIYPRLSRAPSRFLCARPV